MGLHLGKSGRIVFHMELQQGMVEHGPGYNFWLHQFRSEGTAMKYQQRRFAQVNDDLANGNTNTPTLPTQVEK